MKSTILSFFAVLCCIGTIQAQKVSLSLNGNYRTESEDFGIGAQVMIPVYKNFFLAPDFGYFFEKEYKFDSSWIKSNTKSKSIVYGLDIHYAFFLKGTASFVSPFLGVEGQTYWGRTEATSYSPPSSFGNTITPGQWTSFGSNDWRTSSDVVGNIGLAGKWFLGSNFFFNTQVRYSLYFDNMDYNYFMFTAGVGYAF